MAMRHALHKQVVLPLVALLCLAHLVGQYCGESSEEGLVHLPWDGPVPYVPSCQLVCTQQNHTSYLCPKFSYLESGGAAAQLRSLTPGGDTCGWLEVSAPGLWDPLLSSAGGEGLLCTSLVS